MLECVANLSVPSREEAELLGAFSGTSLRDLHHDADHGRAVLTLIGEAVALEGDLHLLARVAAARLDLTGHVGVHPRLGALDVVPFVSLEDDLDAAVRARDAAAAWFATALGVPVFLYGPLADGTVRTLPEVRRHAFTGLAPDHGPGRPHPRLGASALGARGILVAWNLRLRDTAMDEARGVARALRGPQVRALAFALGSGPQVSCNLLDPLVVGPGEVYDAVAARLGETRIVGCELVGLAPRALLERTEPARWDRLGLSEAATIEAR
ncbi:MAG TPA: hypothetical protein PLS29_04390, partial [Acidimicrobiales bacterium]|nr:hypothetical protein [Acidimicrobiales bacterium]